MDKTLIIPLIIIGIFLLLIINNEETYQKLKRGTRIIRDYQLDKIENYMKLELNDAIRAFNTFVVTSDYDTMLYSYSYLFWHFWINSAVKPEYKDKLKKYIAYNK